MKKLERGLADDIKVIELARSFEAGVSGDSGEVLSRFARHPDWVRWCQARRVMSYAQWDAIGAASVALYQRTFRPTTPPILNESGVCIGVLPRDVAERLEAAYLSCPEVAWRDERPEGTFFDPHVDVAIVRFYEDQAKHRRMSPEVAQLLTQILSSLRGEIEKICGHYWAAGAVRLHSQNHVDGGWHSDMWPLSIKKLIIYPSGASEQLGSTEFRLRSGEQAVVTGDKGTWAIFENTAIIHQAIGPKRGSPPRPTIELAILPALDSDPEVRSSGIHVGYPWLPPDIESMDPATAPTAFSPREIRSRILKTAFLIGGVVPRTINLPEALKGLGLYD